MVSKVSLKITELLISGSVINDEDKDLYQYGFFMLLSKLLYFVFACLIGTLFGLFFESVIFFVAFMFIRQYAGGYHASTEIRCNIMTSFSIVACIAVMKLSELRNINIVLLVLSIVAIICIFILCPLDTPEKPLSKKEFKYFKKVSLAILFVITVLIIVSYIFSYNIFFAPCCMSVILESVLLLAGQIKKKRRKRQSSV